MTQLGYKPSQKKSFYYAIITNCWKIIYFEYAKQTISEDDKWKFSSFYLINLWNKLKGGIVLIIVISFYAVSKLGQHNGAQLNKIISKIVQTQPKFGINCISIYHFIFPLVKTLLLNITPMRVITLLNYRISYSVKVGGNFWYNFKVTIIKKIQWISYKATQCKGDGMEEPTKLVLLLLHFHRWKRWKAMLACMSRWLLFITLSMILAVMNSSLDFPSLFIIK